MPRNRHYWWSGFGSGMDNSPQSRAAEPYPPHSWVDCDANEAMAAYYLIKMAKVAGYEDIAAESRNHYAEPKCFVDEDMWSEADRFYLDLDRDGSFLKVETVADGAITEPHHVEGLVQGQSSR